MQQNFFDNGAITSAVDMGADPAQQQDPVAAQQAAAAQEQEKQNRMQRVMEYINSLPEHQRAEAMKNMATDFGMAGMDAGADMSRADALRQKAPQGRTTGSNQLYQSANPLEFLAAGLNNKKRQDEYNTGLEARGAARQGATDARMVPMEEMLRQR